MGGANGFGYLVVECTDVVTGQRYRSTTPHKRAGEVLSPNCAAFRTLRYTAKERRRVLPDRKRPVCWASRHSPQFRSRATRPE
jgi:hypothetical protein